MSRIVLRGCRPLNAPATDLVIQGDRITALGRADVAVTDRIFDAAGLIALPGLVDLHSHFREPGTGSATVASESRAAAAGGFTAVNVMANTNPTADTAERVEWLHDEGLRINYVTLRPVGAVTKALLGHELADISAMANSRAAVTMFSDDGVAVADSGLMRDALIRVAEFDGVIAQHAQDPALTVGAQINDGEAARATNMVGWPSVAEEDIIARDIALARDVGARLHICHVSTAGSVDLIRWAKSNGVAVTAEVTPHHLLLTDELAVSGDPLFKVNPPLRSSDDVTALRTALADGTIDAVATDHAPHAAAKKAGDWTTAANGMVGLETALSVVQLAMLDNDLLDWATLADRMSRAPARIARIGGYSGIVVGAQANLVLYDPGALRTFDTSMLAGASHNSPYLGKTFPGQVIATFHRGVPTVWEGRIQELPTHRTSSSRSGTQ